MRGDTSYLGPRQSRGKNNSAKTGGELAETERRLARMCEAPEALDVGRGPSLLETFSTLPT